MTVRKKKERLNQKTNQVFKEGDVRDDGLEIQGPIFVKLSELFLKKF